MQGLPDRRRQRHDSHFTAGIVQVAWRRLPKSNPRQLTLADIRRPADSR